ncbi:unnamed protein product [Fusarium graminearum]|uniref:Uncharacterized protein n=1 Tax=Gibberella zeae TaxID=5518 RepID=A0A4E9EJA6_GIBZA|nr:unnamed protein product [Fusarium graminearum]
MSGLLDTSLGTGTPGTRKPWRLMRPSKALLMIQEEGFVSKEYLYLTCHSSVNVLSVSPANSLLAAIADTVLRRKKRCWWCLSDQVKRMFEVVLGVDGHRVAYDVVVAHTAKTGTWIALHVRSNYGGVAFDLSSPAVMFE